MLEKLTVKYYPISVNEFRVVRTIAIINVISK